MQLQSVQLLINPTPVQMTKDKLFFLFLTTLYLSFQNVTPARILAVIPTASYSHQMFFQQIWRELALRGHDMIVITTDPTNETLPNLKEVSIRSSYPLFKRLINLFLESGNFGSYFQEEMAKITEDLLHLQLNLPQVQAIFLNKTEHFDLVMIEHMPGPYYALKKRFDCPSIGMMSLDAFPSSHEAMGNPTHSVLYPHSLLSYHGEMSFKERLLVVAFDMLSRGFEYLSGKFFLSEFTKPYFGMKVDVIEAFEETDLMFINANPLFTLIRPLTPSTINLAGGVHIKPPKELPQDIKNFLDHSPEYVIYFSFGTNVISKDLSLEMRQIILTTLAQLPYKVLWKFEDDTLPGKPANVMITKWAPQQDVLRHPKVNLFITQGGIQSLEESLYTHVPMVVIPFLADQKGNAFKVHNKGLGLTIHPSNLNVDNFKTAILEVMKNPVYKKNVETLAAQIQDQPMVPLERAVWWTEYVLRHKGAQHLKGPKIPLYQYFYLDILCFICFVVAFLISGVLFCIKVCLKFRPKKNAISKKIKSS